jgi:hypothetical protein
MVSMYHGCCPRDAGASVSQPLLCVGVRTSMHVAPLLISCIITCRPGPVIKAGPFLRDAAGGSWGCQHPVCTHPAATGWCAKKGSLAYFCDCNSSLDSHSLQVVCGEGGCCVRLSPAGTQLSCPPCELCTVAPLYVPHTCRWTGKPAWSLRICCARWVMLRRP